MDEEIEERISGSSTRMSFEEMNKYPFKRREYVKGFSLGYAESFVEHLGSDFESAQSEGIVWVCQNYFHISFWETAYLVFELIEDVDIDIEEAIERTRQLWDPAKTPKSKHEWK